MKSLDHIPRYIRFATRVSSRPECQKELLRLAQQLFSAVCGMSPIITAMTNRIINPLIALVPCFVNLFLLISKTLSSCNSESSSVL